MTLTITFAEEGAFSAEEMRRTIADSLAQQLRQAVAQRDYYLDCCRKFEEQYGMDCDAFMNAFESGEIGDNEDFFIWFGNKNILDSWERRVQILSGASVGTF